MDLDICSMKNPEFGKNSQFDFGSEQNNGINSASMMEFILQPK